MNKTTWRVEATDYRGIDILPKGAILLVEADSLEEAVVEAALAVKENTLYRPSYILVYSASVEDITLV